MQIAQYSKKGKMDETAAQDRVLLFFKTSRFESEMNSELGRE